MVLSAVVPRSRASAVVAGLAVTQTVGYGALYYSFAVFLTPVAADLHVSITAVTGALTTATLAGALAAVPVGTWLDRRGGRALMTAGSVAGTVLLGLLSTVDSLVELYLVWTGIGLVTAMVLYEAAFAVVVSWYPDARVRASAVLAVTVVAGFASSIFLPLTGALVDAYGWRTAALVLAAVHAALTVPLHGLVLRRAAQPSAETAREPHAVRTALHDRVFWVLAVAFVAHNAATSAMTVHLVAYLVEAGHPVTFAASVAGLLGVLSVTGRLVTTGLQRRIRTTTVVAAVFAVQALSAACLPLIGGTPVGAVVGVVGFGFGFGVATIARPTLLAARYDTSRYATISGVLSVPLTIAKAGAPLAAAWWHGATHGYPPVLLGIAAAGLVAALGIAVAGTTLARGSL
jgi:MFS family permease